jgi:hypothetical protein
MPIEGLDPVRFSQIQAAIAGSMQEPKKSEPLSSLQGVVEVAVELSLDSEEKDKSRSAAIYERRPFLARKRISEFSQIVDPGPVENEPMKLEIWRQTYVLMSLNNRQHGQGSSPPESGQSEERGPHTRKEPSGEIAGYFSVENTGQRILALWFERYDHSVDRQEWVLAVKGSIEQAYAEVSRMFRGLPQVALDTKEFMMAQLNEFAVQGKETR